ncbi:MAG: hypothetical protein PHE55_20665 [Methylococcaceae bacterium]|nr:hypothetical protein [Methylococcaceae bacterium]
MAAENEQLRKNIAMFGNANAVALTSCSNVTELRLAELATLFNQACQYTSTSLTPAQRTAPLEYSNKPAELAPVRRSAFLGDVFNHKLKN